MAEQSSAWKRFWNRGGIWRALLLAAVYLGVYELIGFLIGLVVHVEDGRHGGTDSAASVFFGTALPLIITSLLLLGFAASVGWLKELFSRQALGGRRWMWIGLIVVLIINVAALFSIDYGKAGIPLVGTWLFAGLLIGLVEELVTRGFVVNLMRKGGGGTARSPSPSPRPASSLPCTSRTSSRRTRGWGPRSCRSSTPSRSASACT